MRVRVCEIGRKSHQWIWRNGSHWQLCEQCQWSGGLGRSKVGGAGRGLGGEGLAVARGDNFWAQLDPERRPEEWSGSWRDTWSGEGVF